MVKNDRLISAPHLRMEIIRLFRRRLSVRSIVNRFLASVYRSRCPARCPKLTLDGRRRQCGLRRHKGVGPQALAALSALSDGSYFTLFHSDGLARASDLRTITVVPQSGYGASSTMLGGVNRRIESSPRNATSGFSVRHGSLGDGRVWTKFSVCPGQFHAHTAKQNVEIMD